MLKYDICTHTNFFIQSVNRKLPVVNEVFVKDMHF